MRDYIIESIKECPKKGFLQTLGLKSTQNTYFKEMDAISEAIRLADFSQNTFNFTDYLNEQLGDLYLSEQEKRLTIALINDQLVRYALYEHNLGREILKRKGFEEIFIGNDKISVHYDLIVKNDDGSIELIKFHRSAPTLSHKARKEDNKPSNSIGLFLLFRAGKQMYRDVPIVASFYHLKNKDDKTDNFILDFEHKPNKNIVSYSFSREEERMREEEVLELLSRELTLNSPCPDSKLCQDCRYSPLCSRVDSRKGNELILLTESTRRGDFSPTEDQLKVINFKDGICRVNAAAGTGKTTVIALRVVELLKSGVRPQDILLITFTNKACEEMKEKIKLWLGKKDIDTSIVEDLNIFTFNGFGMSILKKHHRKLGFANPPSIANKVDKYDIIFGLVDEIVFDELNMRNPLLDFPNAKGAVVQLAIWFERIKVIGYQNPAEFAKEEEVDEALANKVFEAYSIYNQKLRERNLIEYHDQIKLVIDLFKNFPEIHREYQYQHVMIDEYQDTDPSQFLLTKILMRIGEVKSLMVVGDDAQAIYKFRLADQNNIINFHNEFENVQDIYILSNFRSTPEILHVANLLNEKNSKRIEKTLISGLPHGSGQEPELIYTDNLDMEKEALLNEISMLKERGFDYHQIAIIARTGSELKEMKEFLENNQIPVQLNIPLRLIDYPAIQDIISIAETIMDKENTFSFLQFLTGTINQQGMEIMRLMDKDAIQRFIHSELDTFNIPEDASQKLEYFYNLVESTFSEDKVVYDFVEKIKSMGFETMEQLHKYLTKLQVYEDDGMVEKSEDKFNAINLITAHSSKGKEYDVVLLLLDKFGGNVDTASEENIDEERRLLFVSITRAKKILKVLYRTDKRKDNLFIHELEGFKRIEYVTE